MLRLRKKGKKPFFCDPHPAGVFSRDLGISLLLLFLVLPVFLGFGLLLGIDASGIHSFLGKRKENMLENVKMSPFRPSAAARAFWETFSWIEILKGMEGRRTLKFFFERISVLYLIKSGTKEWWKTNLRIFHLPEKSFEKIQCELFFCQAIKLILPKKHTGFAKKYLKLHLWHFPSKKNALLPTNFGEGQTGCGSKKERKG